MLRLAVCASGGGGNLRNLYQSSFYSSSFEISNVLVDRECGAIQVAREFNTECTIAKDSHSIAESIDRFFATGCDFVVLAGFMPILSASTCNKFARKIINTHPSLLPRHGGRGMYGTKVQESVLRNMDRDAGCSIHFVNATIDGGQVILQISFPVPFGIGAWDLGGMVFQAESVALPLALNYLSQELVG